MKEFIYSNYDIFVDKIYFKDNKCFFFKNDFKIYIFKIKYEKITYINDLIKLTNDLYNIISVNTFILNKDKNYLTKYEEEYLVLVRVNNVESDFELNDIYKFWNINSNLKDYDILNEWKNEVDNLEKKLVMFNKEFMKVQMSVNYYIGMAENAIQLLNDYKDYINKNNDSISHKLSYMLFNSNSLYDPFTFIKSNKMYDISNYIKYKFYKNEIDYNEIENFFNNGNEYENVFLFCNLMYPSEYFDLIKKIFNEKEEESKINVFVNMRKNYIKLLTFCKKIVKINKNIKLINWF